MGTGRPTDAALREVRGRVEELMLAGLKPSEIRRAMAGQGNPLSERAVERHCQAVRAGWRARTGDLEGERAEVVAQVREAARVAVSRATLHSRSNLGVGYLNVHLKALERLARLLGLDAPLRTELSRRVPAGLAEVVISDAQMAERLRLAADDFDERAKAEA